MKKLLKATLALLVVLLVVLAGAGVWAKSASDARLGKTYETHRVDFPIPFPLSETERALVLDEKKKALPPDAPADTDVSAGIDWDALAKERAIARGKHLLEARYGCAECHGKDFGGGVMIDAPVLGVFLGKNLTTGKGSVTLEYQPADWDRLVRHGIKRDGHPTTMPATDFFEMTDQELSDLVSYIRSMPPVDKTVPDIKVGPLGYVLMANGTIVVPAEMISDHQKAHPVAPPDETSLAFGKLLAQPCVGCHRQDFSGGPIRGGDPSWAPARNISPHADGLAGWTEAEFMKVLLTATRRDGTALKVPMTVMTPYAARMTKAEQHALFTYLQSVPPVPTPQK
ncbi:MAG: c-type cytochrome [Myxococcaceae bacterium]